jgi:hypothetical protein
MQIISLKTFGTILFVTIVGWPVPSLAHRRAVHMKITEAAGPSSPGLTVFLSDHLGKDEAPFTDAPLLRANNLSFAPIEWMKQGSYHQDDVPWFMHHFYNVTRTPKELTDIKNWQRWVVSVGGGQPSGFVQPIQSFIWASEKNRGNVYAWYVARGYQYDALTKSSPLDRHADLAGMLLTLGHVLHLNQDLSQPGHTRNDQHPPYERDWIEDYGKDYYQSRSAWFTPPHINQRGWAYWQNAGFQKLEDFWDRRLYTGQNSAKLNEDANGQVKLGLAEFSNGNFLSEDAIYGAYFTFGTEQYNLHYFPFPSRFTSTTYPVITAQIQSGDVDPRDYADGLRRNSVYLHKTGDGIQFRNHSVFPFFLAMNLNRPNILTQIYQEYTPHINDPNVLDRYHSILLPKAVQYSAGILDYFFRGQFETAWIAASAPEKSALRIVNKSAQTLQGGAFLLAYDQANGTRALIIPQNFTTTYTGTLANNDAIEAEFTTPTGPITSYTLVYKGTIGVSGTTALDPVDKDIAIAAKRITCIEGPGEPILCDDWLFHPYRHIQESSGIGVLRVKDFSALVPSLLPCGTCLVGSALPEWNGDIPLNQIGPGASYIKWATEDPSHSPEFTVSMNGASVAAYVWSDSCHWRLEIVCLGSGQPYPRIWEGRKSKGYSPRGTYVVDLEARDPGCAAAQIPCITIE